MAAPPRRASAAEAKDDAAEDAAVVCPTREAVWASISTLVPEAAPQLASARPRMGIDDLGARYRVRVATSKETFERDYLDPARDCAKRARFAAEFIVLALMPPRIAEGAPTGGAATTASAPAPIEGAAEQDSSAGASASAASPRESPSRPPAPEPKSASDPRPEPRPEPRRRQPPEALPTTRDDRKAAWVRIEASGAMGLAPPHPRAPSFVSWGGQLRGRVGGGPIAAVVGGSYWPPHSFRAGGFEGSIMRAPANAGIRLEALGRPIEIDVDATLSAAFEHFEGVSPKIQRHGSRLTPGVEVAIEACPAPLGGFAPFLAAHVSWFPVRQELFATPSPVLDAPSLWVFLAVGASYTP